jgi:hypothetical protein
VRAEAPSPAAPTLLDAAAAEPPVEVAEPADAAADQVDAFDLVWPALARHLAEPRTEREVADCLGLELTQARKWLARAAEDGRVTVKQRPKRYELAGDPAERLFPAPGA